MALVEIIGQQPLVEVSSKEPAEVIVSGGTKIRMNVVVDSDVTNVTISSSQGLQGATGAQGPTGPQGPAGPNSISTSTATTINGILAGNGTTVQEAQIATNRLLGRSTAGTGDIEEIQIGTGLQLSGGTLVSTAAGVPSGTASGTDTYTATIANVAAYNTNSAFVIKFTNANTGASTLNINGLGAINLYKSVNSPLSGGDIKAGQEFIVVYDGANFQVIGLASSQAYIQNTAPSGSGTASVPNGAIWFHSDTGIQYTYYHDADTFQWVQETLPLGPQGPQGANGTNTVNSLTATTFNGILKGNGSTFGTTTVTAELGFTPENVANKENVTLDNSSTKYPTNNLVKTSLDSFADDVDYAIMTNQRILFNF